MKNINFIIIAAVLTLSGVSVYGQISTDESPVSFSADIVLASDARDVKTLPDLDMETIHQEDEEDEPNGIPPRFGYRHEVNYNLDNSGTWTTLPNDDKIWQLELYCPEALSINLLYDKFHLPEGAKFFVFSSNGEHAIGAFTSENNKGDAENVQGFATGLIYGDRFRVPDLWGNQSDTKEKHSVRLESGKMVCVWFSC
jgi:hypothetical protein